MYAQTLEGGVFNLDYQWHLIARLREPKWLREVCACINVHTLLKLEILSRIQFFKNLHGTYLVSLSKQHNLCMNLTI